MALNEVLEQTEIPQITTMVECFDYTRNETIALLKRDFIPQEAGYVSILSEDPMFSGTGGNKILEHPRQNEIIEYEDLIDLTGIDPETSFLLFFPDQRGGVKNRYTSSKKRFEALYEQVKPLLDIPRKTHYGFTLISQRYAIEDNEIKFDLEKIKHEHHIRTLDLITENHVVQKMLEKVNPHILRVN